PSGTGPPTQMPLRLEAAILSRTRSPISSRSNWANDSRTLSVSRPMLELVLKDWGHRHKRDAVGIEQLDELGEISERTGQPVDLVHQHNVDLARAHIGQELLQRRAVERGTGECTIVVAAGDQPPAVVRLALYICLAGLALGVERVEG